MNLLWYIVLGVIFLILLALIIFFFFEEKYIMVNNDVGRGVTQTGSIATSVSGDTGLQFYLSGSSTSYIHKSNVGILYIVEGDPTVRIGTPPDNALIHFMYDGQLVRSVRNKNLVLVIRPGDNAIITTNIAEPLPGLNYNWVYKKS